MGEILTTEVETSVRCVLEYIVGLNADVADRILDSCRLQVDGQAYLTPEERIKIQVGSRIHLEGHSALTVIEAHLRTLDFYLGIGFN